MRQTVVCQLPENPASKLSTTYQFHEALLMHWQRNVVPRFREPPQMRRGLPSDQQGDNACEHYVWPWRARLRCFAWKKVRNFSDEMGVFKIWQNRKKNWSRTLKFPRLNYLPASGCTSTKERQQSVHFEARLLFVDAFVQCLKEQTWWKRKMKLLPEIMLGTSLENWSLRWPSKFIFQKKKKKNYIKRISDFSHARLTSLNADVTFLILSPYRL